MTTGSWPARVTTTGSASLTTASRVLAKLFRDSVKLMVFTGHLLSVHNTVQKREVLSNCASRVAALADAAPTRSPSAPQAITEQGHAVRLPGGAAAGVPSREASPHFPSRRASKVR